jgi:hypothetical protein
LDRAPRISVWGILFDLIDGGGIDCGAAGAVEVRGRLHQHPDGNSTDRALSEMVTVRLVSAARRHQDRRGVIRRLSAAASTPILAHDSSHFAKALRVRFLGSERCLFG